MFDLVEETLILISAFVSINDFYMFFVVEGGEICGENLASHRYLFSWKRGSI